MNIYKKLTIATIVFLLFFSALDIKLHNMKVKREIIRLEEKSKDLNIRLSVKRKKFEKLLSPKYVEKLAAMHNIPLKDMESIKIIKIIPDKLKNPVARK